MMQRYDFLLTFFLVASLLLTASLSLADSSAPVLVSAGQGYFQPDPYPKGTNVSNSDGITAWSDPSERVVWHGFLKSGGDLNVALSLKLDAGQKCKFAVHIGRQKKTAVVSGSGDDQTVDFGSFRVKSGPVAIQLEGVEHSGDAFGQIFSLELSGPASESAHFSGAEKRSAASVHLFYRIPESTHPVAFYTSVRATADPIWTYYCACGFWRGYFGIQVISPTERRIIFSVWDDSKEPISRDNVAGKYRAKLMAKGPDVVVTDFGNEGTGAHSHLVYPWKTGETYHLLVTAKPADGGAVYTGYFYFPEKKKWGVIASFFAPNAEPYLPGLYSFDEDFVEANGDKKRMAYFGPQWIMTDDGKWSEVTQSTFSFTDNAKADRLDRSGGASKDSFFLTTGGFEYESSQKYGELFTRDPSKEGPPNIDIKEIEKENGISDSK